MIVNEVADLERTFLIAAHDSLQDFGSISRRHGQCHTAEPTSVVR